MLTSCTLNVIKYEIEFVGPENLHIFIRAGQTPAAEPTKAKSSGAVDPDAAAQETEFILLPAHSGQPSV